MRKRGREAGSVQKNALKSQALNTFSFSLFQKHFSSLWRESDSHHKSSLRDEHELRRKAEREIMVEMSA
jgi:hypothetical protein